MVSPAVSSGQDVSLDDMKLDDLSLDDDALFADLDNEVRLDPSAGGGDMLSLDIGDSPAGGSEDMNLDFDVEAVGEAPAPKAPSKTAPAKPAAKAAPSKAAAPKDDFSLDLDDTKLGGDDFNLDLDDTKLGGGDLDLELDDSKLGGDALDLNLDGVSAGGGGDLDLDISDAAPAGGMGAGGGDLNLDLDAGGSDDLNLDLGDAQPAVEASALGDDLTLEMDDAPAAPAASGEEELDLTLDMDEPAPVAAAPASDDFDMNLDMDEPAPAAAASPAEADPLSQMDTFEVDLGDSSAGSTDVEDLSQPMGADKLGRVEFSDDTGSMPASDDEALLDMSEIPAADAADAAPAGTFQAVPDVNIDAIDLSLDAPAPTEFKAAPDVDLDAVDLESLDVPMAEQKGDEGAPMDSGMGVAAGMAAGAAVGAAAMSFARRASDTDASDMPSSPAMSGFSDLHQGGDGGENLLELNLADLEPEPMGFGAEPMGFDEPISVGPQSGPTMRMVSPATPSMGGAAQSMHSMSHVSDAEVSSKSVNLAGSVLLSIPHQVQVRMGSVNLLGQDILNLNYGSVVPLNRTVGEPVDLTLDGKTIAQGEIVLINGRNLGVRIVGLNK